MNNTTTTATVKATRYITRKDCICGAGRTSALMIGSQPAQSKELGPVFYGDTLWVGGDICIECRGCGLHRGAEMVRGKFSAAHKCNAKCLASKGPSCECSCGGKNHGASYSVAA